MDRLVKGMAADDTLLVVALVDTIAVERARVIHDTYPTATAALGRVISAAALLGSMLREGQKVVVQVSGDGPLKGVVAESDQALRVRGYVKRPHVHLDLREGKLDVGGAVGKGFMNIIKDLGLKEPYQGVVALQSGEIAEDLAYYLKASEQIPSAVGLGVFVDTDNSVKASGGFMLQALPGIDDHTIGHLEERLKMIRPVSSMVLDGLGPKEILSEVLALDYKVIEERDVLYQCTCSKERVLDSLAALGHKEIEDLIEKPGPVELDCGFCGAKYEITPEELKGLLGNE